MEEMDDLPPLEDTSAASKLPEVENNSNETMESPNKNVSSKTNNSNKRNKMSDESDDDDEDVGEGEGWVEIDDEVEDSSPTSLCLFCTDMFDTPCSLFYHMEVHHHFSLRSMACHWSFDQMMFIRYVNYIRREKPKPPLALSLKPPTFKDDIYMKPIIPNDPVLMFDVDEFFEYTDEEEEADDGSSVASLQATVDELRDVVHRQRQVMQRLIDEAQGRKVLKTVSDLNADEDEGYFNSYAYFDIHHEMLSDKVRTEAYREAILQNEPLFREKIVLDLGCGTGILSMFAAKAGATKVFAVDMSEVIYHAMEIVKENSLDKAISLRKGRLEDLNFDHKFDVIVSEWMGYFLLFEGMLDSVIHARTHYLQPGGYLLPNRCTLYLVGIQDMVAYDKYIDFWKDVYGFKMSCMVRESIKEACTEVVRAETVCTTPVLLRDFDLMKVKPEDTEFTQAFVMKAVEDANLTAFVGYFDTNFELPHPVHFSTGPHAPPTHWKQTIFYLSDLTPVKKDEEIHGTIAVRRKKAEIRSLDVIITFKNKRYQYFVE